jgi:hypothetical protein
MKVTKRGYKIPDQTDPLDLSLEMFKETFSKIEREHDGYDGTTRKVQKFLRQKLISTALGYNPWEVK